MALPENIVDQIKKMKGEKKAKEVVEYIRQTYPAVKIGIWDVYSAWKGTPRKSAKKKGKAEELEEKVRKFNKKRGKAAPGSAIAGSPKDELTIEQLIRDIHQAIDDSHKFFKGVLLAIRGDLLKKTAELRKSQAVDDPDEIKLGED